MSFNKRGNQAIATNGNTQNGVTADIAITTRGSDWYFAVCAAMFFATLLFLVLGHRKTRGQRIFHYITAGITLVAAIAYFSMGSNLGWTPIRVEYQRSRSNVHGLEREIFYVRYIDWFITTPLLLLDLLLTAALPWYTILFVLLVDEVMIVTGLVGALVTSSYKWGYFAFGCAALLYIIYVLVWEARRQASRIGADVGRAFISCGSLTAFLWILYPIAWGLCEGGNVISPNGEAVFYGILDVLAKPIFGALLIWGHRSIDPARLGLHIREYDGTDAFITEKGTHAHGTHGVTHGTNSGLTTNTGVVDQTV